MAGTGMKIMMRTALAMLALGLLLSSAALAADCGCKTKCGSKSKCACMQQCGCKRNKCECASRSYCKCKSQCRNRWGNCGKWADANACCPPKADVVTVCDSGCSCSSSGHPYERVYNGSSMLCDTGCKAYIPCKRVGLTCTTKCEARSSNCACNKCRVDYCITQECQEIERPRLVPWWFSGGKGNLYLEANDPAPAMVDDWAGGSKIAGAAGSPEPSAEQTMSVEAS
jgi:hypothetical protein